MKRITGEDVSDAMLEIALRLHINEIRGRLDIMEREIKDLISQKVSTKH